MSLGFPTDEEARAVSPTSYAVVAQDAFEPVLLDHLRTYPTDMRFGSELVSFSQDDTGVTSTVLDRATGELTTIRSRFIVAADGGRSPIRTALGIGMVGPDHLEDYHSTLFTAPLSAQVGSPVHGLNMIPGPAGPAVLLPTSDDGRWVFAQPWDPRTQSAQDYSRRRLIELIRTATGVPGLPVDTVTSMAFSFAAQLADRYRSGNAFLVGDAAHRITPRGGTGLNTAIQDAHNLAWKLAFVLNGWADRDLLDSYESERRPVGECNVRRSAEPTSPDVDALGIDLGVTYDSGALTSDGSEPQGTGQGWRPSARPGARLPHLWLERSGRPVSTMDLLGPGLTLLTGPSGVGWGCAAREAIATTGVPLQVEVVGTDNLHDPDRDLTSIFEIDDDGAVLVRPDGHVAWRARSKKGLDPHQELHRGIAAALGEKAQLLRDLRSIA